MKVNNKIIYLDNAATTMTYKKVVDDMMEYFTQLYGNPSSVYEFAGKSKQAIEDARGLIADTLGAKNQEIFFTSGGTESDNWALRSVTKVFENKGKHIITSRIEHPAIINTAANLEELGYEVTYLNVDENGFIRLNELEKSIRSDTILISIMAANNEIGTLQPIKEIGKIAKKYNIVFHTDAVQMYGQLPINVDECNIDMLSASAHKFHGPKGIGFLYVRSSVSVVPFIFGGGQENHKRAGTQNVPCIVGMASAAQVAHEDMLRKAYEESRKRDYFINRILKEIPFTRLNGDRVRRLPGNVNISIQFIDASELLASLDMNGICASSGSACSSNNDKPSYVLSAIDLPENLIFSTIRMTLSGDTSKEELDYVVEILKRISKEYRENSNEYAECFAN